MTMRLTNDQFMALRSIAREPWDLQWRRIQWKFNGKWFHLDSKGWRSALDAAYPAHCGYGQMRDRAWDAAWGLEALGLVEISTIRCCPGTSCHLNDRNLFQPSERGAELLRRIAIGHKRSEEPAAPAPAPTATTTLKERLKIGAKKLLVLIGVVLGVSLACGFYAWMMLGWEAAKLGFGAGLFVCAVLASLLGG